MSREVFALFYLGMVALLLVIFFLIPRFPYRLRNIPNRNYWLAKERRVETLEYVNKASMRVGITTLVLMIFVMQYAFEANLKQEPRLSGNAGWALILYFLFLAAWLFRFLRKFRLPK